MKCRNCGAHIVSGDRFCNICGCEVGRRQTNPVNIIIISAVCFVVACLSVLMVWHIITSGHENSSTQAQLSSPQAASESSAPQQQTTSGTVPYDHDIDSSMNGDCVIDGSDRHYLSYSDISWMSDDQLMLARNEIYARRGRMFKDPYIRSYFESKSWYEGTIYPDDFSEDILSKVEKANVQLIRKEEKSRGN